MRENHDQTHFSPQVVAGSRLVLIGLGASLARALIYRAVYIRSRQGHDLAGIALYSAARRTLSTAGGVMIAFGVRDIVMGERLGSST